MKKRLLNNIGLKIVSIVVAAFAWLAIMNISDPIVTETFTDIPVQIVNEDVVTSRGYQYSIENGEKIDIRVEGKRSIINKLTGEDFIAAADFATFNAMYMANIKITCTADSADEIIASSRTEAIAIKLEDKDTQSFSVKIIQNGQVREGYFVSNATVGASLVQVEGAATQISKIKELVAEINVDDRKSSFTAEVPLIALDDQGNPIDSNKFAFSQSAVYITINILPTAEVPINIVTAGTPRYGYYADTVDYAPNVVKVAATEDVLKRLVAVDVVCDINDARDSKDFRINLDEYISQNYNGDFVLVEPNTNVGVIVNVKPMESVKLELQPEDIEIRNSSEGYEYNIQILNVSAVHILGRPDEVANVSVDDLGLYVDVASYGQGTYARTLMTDYNGNVIVELGNVLVTITEHHAPPTLERGAAE